MTALTPEARRAFGSAVRDRLIGLGVPEAKVGWVIHRSGGVRAAATAADIYEETEGNLDLLVDMWRAVRSRNPGSGFQTWAEVNIVERVTGVKVPDDEIEGPYGPVARKAGSILTALAAIAEAVGYGH